MRECVARSLEQSEPVVQGPLPPSFRMDAHLQIPVGSTLTAVAHLPPAGLSVRMQCVYDLMRRFAASETTVTIVGEAGTGKALFAHAVHNISERATGPFVVFDCAAVLPHVMESELFGNENAAETRERASPPCAFARAQGGTLFLDEISALPIDLQPRLFRALDNRAVRIVAATNRDLAGQVRTNLFRLDLYFRLAAAFLHLPPLRERLEDLPILVDQLLSDLGRRQIRVSQATYDVLGAHMWPGNLRELKNTLVYALAFAVQGVIEPHHIKFLESNAELDPLDRLPLAGQSLDALERTAIRQTLLQTRGNKVQAARTLGIAASTLYEKLKRYGL